MYCSPDALFGEILNKESFSGSDLTLDPPGIFPLVFLSTALGFQGAVGEDNILLLWYRPQRGYFTWSTN